MKKVIACTLCISLISAGLTYSSVTLSASKIKLNKANLTMTTGQTYKLIVKNNKKPVKWSSSKKKVASVTKKGKVTAKKKGKTNITAKVSGKKLVCKVKVKKAASPKTNIALDIAQTINLTTKDTQILNSLTNKPGASSTPDVTREPGVTDAPDVTKEPGNTDTPDVTKEPGNTDAPDVTKKPESTDAPVTEATATPEPKPTATVNPNSLAAAPTEDPNTKDDGWVHGCLLYTSPSPRDCS